MYYLRDTPPDDEEFYSKEDKYCEHCGGRFSEDEQFYKSDEDHMICYDCKKIEHGNQYFC